MGRTAGVEPGCAEGQARPPWEPTERWAFPYCRERRERPTTTPAWGCHGWIADRPPAVKGNTAAGVLLMGSAKDIDTAEAESKRPGKKAKTPPEQLAAAYKAMNIRDDG